MRAASRLVLAVGLPLLAGCAGGGGYAGDEARVHEQTVAACRQRADEAYDITHRDQIYASESQTNMPFSANYQPGMPDRGLPDLFQRDQMVSDCVRNTGADSDRTPPGPSAPAAPSPPAGPSVPSAPHP